MQRASTSVQALKGAILLQNGGAVVLRHAEFCFRHGLVVAKQIVTRQIWRLWLRDISGFLACVTVFSLLYIIVTCSIDARAGSVPHSSQGPTDMFSSSTSAGCCPAVQLEELLGNYSTAHDAPTAGDYNKIQLFPPYSASVYDVGAPPVGIAVQDSSPMPLNTLQQLLHTNAATVVATLEDYSSSMGLGLLGQPQLLLQQLPLLFLWRVWFMADAFLMVKFGMAWIGLAVALLKRDFYCRPRVRTVFITVYTLLPFAVLPMRLLCCTLPSPISAATTSSTATTSAHRSSLSALSNLQQHSWPLSYFRTCPVATSAEAYSALLSYASFAVVVNSMLHPLPALTWQVGVNAASWLCLAGCGALIKLRYAPSMLPAAHAVGSAAACCNSSVGRHHVDVGVLVMELLASCVDGLLLAVLLPLGVTVWFQRRGKQRFMQYYLQEQQTEHPSATAGTVRLIGQQPQQRHVGGGRLQSSGSSSTASSDSGNAAMELNAAADAATAVPRRSGSGQALAPATPSGSDNFTLLLTEQQLSKSCSVRKEDKHVRHVQFVSQVRDQAAAGGQQKHEAAYGQQCAYHVTTPTSTVAGVIRANSRSSLESTGSSGLPTAFSNVRRQSSNSTSNNSSAAQMQQQQVAGSGRQNATTAPAGNGSMFNLGNIQAGLSPPRGPMGSLYSSPLETVVISFKIAPAAQSEAPGSPSTAASAAQHVHAAAAGAPGQQLRADIDAAVRSVVARSQLRILTSSVSTFPGCVHVVMSINLATLQDLDSLAAAGAAATAGAMTDAEVHITGYASSPSSSGGSSGAVAAAPAELQQRMEHAVPGESSHVQLASLIDWQQVVQQLQQIRLGFGEADDESSADSPLPLQLQHMLVQDGSGQQTVWYWQAADATAAGSTEEAEAATALAGGHSSAVAALSAEAAAVTLEDASRNRSAAAADLTHASNQSQASQPSIDASLASSNAQQQPADAAAASPATTPIRPAMTNNLLAAAEARAAAAALATEAAAGLGPAGVYEGFVAGPAIVSFQNAEAASPRADVPTPAPCTPVARSSTTLSPGSGNSPAHITGSSDRSTPAAISLQSDTAAAAAAAAPSVLSTLHAAAHSIILSSFTLPSDQGRLDQVQTVAGFRSQEAGLTGPGRRAASLMPVLTVPDSMAASLAAQGAGLRIVITEAAVVPPAGSRPISIAMAAPQAAAEMLLTTARNGEDGVGAAILADVTYWPTGSRSSSAGSSIAWPDSGRFALHTLLPSGIDAAWLVQRYGRVLSVNVLATPIFNITTAHTGAEAAGVLASECLLLQLPLLVVPSSVGLGLSTLAANMAAEAGSHAIAYHGHMVPLVRDIAALLLQRHVIQRATEAAHSGAAVSVAAMAREQLCRSVLGFLHTQGLDDCLMALQQLVGWGEGADDASSSNVGRAAAVATPAAAAATSQCPVRAGMDEIEGASDTASQAHGHEAEKVTDYIPLITAAAASSSAAAAAVEGVTSTAAATEPAAEVKDVVAIKDDVNYSLVSDHVQPASVAKAVKQAVAARDDAQQARHIAAEAQAALANAIQSLNALSASATAAIQQAQRAESTASAAARRAEAAEAWAQRQRALQLIGSGHVEFGPLGSGIWGLLGAASGRSADDNNMLLSEPPQLPDDVTWRDVVFGFRDARLEVQYRRLKAMHVACIDRAALLLHAVREATVVWRLGWMLLHQAAGGSQLSLVLLCKYEAVTVLPYLMCLLCPDFWIQHRNFMLMLSQIACGLTMGMITATEIYRHEWSTLFAPRTPTPSANFPPGATNITAGSMAETPTATDGLLTRPEMLLVWFYLVVPLLQQLCIPEQLFGGCLSQAVQSYLAYRFIFRGTMPLPVLLLWLVAGAVVSFGVSYAADTWMRRQAVAAARRTVLRGG